MRGRSLTTLLSLMLTAAAAWSAEPAMDRFATPSPKLDPIHFFTGETRSVGVFENARGIPTETVRTRTRGRLKGGVLYLEQDLFVGRRPRQHRSWQVWRVDAHHFAATANDMIGQARGEAFGNSFRWTFTLATRPGNPLFNVRMQQHMYLQPDGRTLVNRTVIRAFGVTAGGVTEQFQRR
jgi:hypothetical protein